jgi:hypothetical protein
MIIMQEWEYKIIEKSISESKLNELGKDGWELVAVVVKSTWIGHLFFFKRPRQLGNPQ